MVNNTTMGTGYERRFESDEEEENLLAKHQQAVFRLYADIEYARRNPMLVMTGSATSMEGVSAEALYVAQLFVDEIFKLKRTIETIEEKHRTERERPGWYMKVIEVLLSILRSQSSRERLRLAVDLARSESKVHGCLGANTTIQTHWQQTIYARSKFEELQSALGVTEKDSQAA